MDINPHPLSSLSQRPSRRHDSVTLPFYSPIYYLPFHLGGLLTSSLHFLSFNPKVSPYYCNCFAVLLCSVHVYLYSLALRPVYFTPSLSDFLTYTTHRTVDRIYAFVIPRPRPVAVVLTTRHAARGRGLGRSLSSQRPRLRCLRSRCRPWPPPSTPRLPSILSKARTNSYRKCRRQAERRLWRSEWPMAHRNRAPRLHSCRWC